MMYIDAKGGGVWESREKRENGEGGRGDLGLEL